jgi:RES domain-containing protein
VILHAWRISQRQHAAIAFTGEGARLFGGRWNSKGTALIYASESASLAALEMLVHLQSPRLLNSYLVARLSFDDSLVEKIDARRLPRNWRSYPALRELQALGDQWLLRRSSAVLQVPSVIVETEHNFLLNPAHPDFSAIRRGRPRPFQFDPRLKG